MSKETNSSCQSEESTHESSQWNGFSKVALVSQVAKILANSEFSNSPRMARFLRFTVEKTLRGEGDELKEYLIGLAVFDRNSEYDPHFDPIVRVEARRLRSKLKHYYDGEGRQDPILIEYPKGHYLPVFTKKNDFTPLELNEPPQIAEPIDRAQEWAEKKKERSTSRIFSRAWKKSSVAILVALIAGSLALWRVRRQPEKTPEKTKEISCKSLTTNSWDNPLDSAAISPDGRYLAFCSKGKLFIQVIRTGEKRLLALPEEFYPAGVSWFPDGTKLLLNRPEERWIQVKSQTTRQSDASLWSLSILGGAPQKIVDHTGSDASVSPDGLQVAFSRFDLERSTADIWVVSANGEGLRKIRAMSEPGPVRFFGPVWSSNNQRLFYLCNCSAIESCDLRGEWVSNIFSLTDNNFLTHCLTLEGRIFFPLYIPWQSGHHLTADLWEIKVDAATGRPLSEARRLTQWSDFGSTQVGQLSVTADGKGLVVVKGHAQADVYVAEFEPDGKAIKTPRRLTLLESDDGAWDWTADSRAVLFVSDRNGNQDIFKQDISQTEAEAIVTSPEYESHPNLSPDRAFFMYLVSEKPGSKATRLMRVAVGGGPPELVLKGEKIKYFSCAREANLCVFAEEIEGKQILTTFDPLKGRGEKLPISDFPSFENDRQDMVTANHILSPQGRLIEKMKPGPEGFHIWVRLLTMGPVQEITFKNLIGDYQFSGWSLDGKGIYITEWTFSDFTLLYAGLDGHSRVLWKRGSSPGWTIHYPIPSPDGRYLAFTSISYEMNAWMLENF